jgi:ribosomal protein L29
MELITKAKEYESKDKAVHDLKTQITNLKKEVFGLVT